MQMKSNVLILLLLFPGMLLSAQFPRFRALAFYSEEVEPAHVEFAHDAIRFFQDLTAGDGFAFDVTSDMNDLMRDDLGDYSIILMLNDFPRTAEQRQAFREYMEQGGGWFGFHVAAYNDRTTDWPWFVDFLGGGVFRRNSWPPMPAKLIVNDALVTKVHRAFEQPFRRQESGELFIVAVYIDHIHRNIPRVR